MNSKGTGNRERFFAAKRTALVLYSILVVLPALVFGGLHWNTLISEHRRQLNAAPQEAGSAAARMLAEMKNRLKAILDIEEARGFQEYQHDYLNEGTTNEVAFVPSQLRFNPFPGKIDAWFAYDLLDEGGEVQMFDGRHSEWLVERENLRRFVERELVRGRTEQLRSELRADKPWPPPEQDPSVTGTRPATRTLPLSIVAINLSAVRDAETLLESEKALGEAASRPVEIPRTGFRLRLMRDEDGKRRLVATRQVLIRAQAGDFPETLEDLARDKVLVQGFFLNADWLLEIMPSQVQHDVLAPHEEFLFWNHPPDVPQSTDAVQTIQLFEEVDIEVEHEADRRLGSMKAVISLGDMKKRFRRQWVGFLSVTAVMAVSLAIGMGLLVRSVRLSLEQARRTENFVAAVTHELRTPIAAVKMYGEMLRDGWVSSQEKQNEYFERIVRESDRLATLVDRVLLKRKLGVEPTTPRPGDLNTVVRSQVAELESAGAPEGDLRFELAEDLPPVLLVHEGVHSVLVNLVENARKYARVRQRVPADSTAASEPILVTTRLSRGKVLLEVSDRGPGIPESERSKIFDAFYRIGDEHTRTTPGTGLGLHLVHIQARAMKARIQALAREGGGATFRVTFKTLSRAS